MTNQEHLDLLKRGVYRWNAWRRKHTQIQIDFHGANLSGANLSGANLSGADLGGADLGGADLSGADLSGADLSGANLLVTDLTHTNLSGADLKDATLILGHLYGADLTSASLINANLTNANLSGANLSGVNLSDANFSATTIGGTLFGSIDLRGVKGLETVISQFPSTLGTDTLERSKGDIPEAFLRKVGLSDVFISYARSLVSSPITYYTCFISSSSKDLKFVRQLYGDLQNKGVRCWYAPENLEWGAKIRPRIDESIRHHDKLLLVLSRSSLSSQWVEQEVETALEKERKEKRMILFPIRLDKMVMEIADGWPAFVRNSRNIGDFTHWKRYDAYQSALNRLLHDLKTET